LAQRQFELDRLMNQANQAQTQYQSLQLRVAQLSSPQRIISTAEGELGMRQPDSVTYLAPSKGSTAPGAAVQSGTRPTAPAGETDWAKIKPYLADTP
ncbi:MAG: cell division protein FtsL, partial [Acidimicrobiaceae bacterium]|nr:cell division protein FtsL [Acidimicrobiaceae bacterium]